MLINYRVRNWDAARKDGDVVEIERIGRLRNPVKRGNK